MSSFSVSGTSVSFGATIESFSDKAGALEEITVGLLIANATDWGALFSLRSWSVTQRPIPGGVNVYVDVGGGSGVGSLHIDNLDPHNAILIALSRAEIEPGSLRSRASATFLITG